MAFIADQLKQVFRRLIRAPLFTTVILITLAVGIGANAIVFGVVYGVLLKPLTYPHPEQLIGVWHTSSMANINILKMSPSFYFIDREQNSTLQDIGMYTRHWFAVTGAGQPEHVAAFHVTDGTLSILGAKPILGRVFNHYDDLPNSPRTIILSYGYWQRRFGGDRSIVGRSLTIGGTSNEIIGVLPRDFTLEDYDASIFAPFQFDRSKMELGGFGYDGVARLRPGVTLNQATTDLQRLIPIAIHSFPVPEGMSLAEFEQANFRSSLHPLKQDVVGDVGNGIWVLMGSIVLVLLVACANVANLLLVRVEGRRQELSVRSALGASRANIAAALLLESLSLGVMGGVLGLTLAFGALRILVAMAPTGLPRLHEIGINLPVLLFTTGASLFVSLVTGLLPVIKYSGLSMYTGLREGRGLSLSRERQRARKALVVV